MWGSPDRNDGHQFRDGPLVLEVARSVARTRIGRVLLRNDANRWESKTQSEQALLAWPPVSDELGWFVLIARGSRVQIPSSSTRSRLRKKWEGPRSPMRPRGLPDPRRRSSRGRVADRSDRSGIGYL